LLKPDILRNITQFIELRRILWNNLNEMEGVALVDTIRIRASGGLL
jgi:hypothetical protein